MWLRLRRRWWLRMCSGVFGLGDGDKSQVGAAGEPPAHLAVLVLDLAALPRRVRVAEPDLQVVVVGEAAPVRPFGAAVEGQRAPQVRGDSVEALDEAGEDRFGVVAVGHGDRDQVAALALGQPDHRGPVVGADDLIDLPVARHRALVDGGGTLGDVRPAGPRPGISPLPAAAPVGAENCVVAGEAAFRYSLMSPPQRAVLTTWRCLSGWSGGSVATGGRWSSERWGRCVL